MAGGGGTMLGESVKIDLRNAAASGTKVSGHGSRLDSVPKSPPLSVKAEYSLFHLGKASDVCGAVIGLKMDAPFCLKSAGTCEITSHKGRHPCCLGACLLLRFTSPVENEVALYPQMHSYLLEDDHADYDEGESEYERLNRMQLLFEWDERLRDCKKREAGFRCFMEFKGSATIIREETRNEAKEYAKDEREHIQMESLGNGCTRRLMNAGF